MPLGSTRIHSTQPRLPSSLLHTLCNMDGLINAGRPALTYGQSNSTQHTTSSSSTCRPYGWKFFQNPTSTLSNSLSALLYSTRATTTNSTRQSSSQIEKNITKAQEHIQNQIHSRSISMQTAVGLLAKHHRSHQIENTKRERYQPVNQPNKTISSYCKPFLELLIFPCSSASRFFLGGVFLLFPLRKIAKDSKNYSLGRKESEKKWREERKQKIGFCL